MPDSHIKWTVEPVLNIGALDLDLTMGNHMSD
jgi:hypothetical protein